VGFFDPVRGEYGRYCFVPFGLRVGPEINDDCVKETLRCYAQKFQQNAPVDFVDDLYNAFALKEDAWVGPETLVWFLLRAGIAPMTKSGGLVAPTTKVTYVGWEICSESMLVTVPEDKAAKGIGRVREVMDANKHNQLRVSTVVSCVGFLSHVSNLVLAGRRHLSELWGAITESGIQEMWQKKKKVDPIIRLDLDAIRELEWWLQTLACPEALTRPIAQIVGPSGSIGGTLWSTRSPDFEAIEAILRDPELRAGVAVFESDASGSFG
jgi:hypothetical protein